MSGNAIAIAPSLVRDEKLHGVLRYVVGSSMIMMVAMGMDYTLAYLTPVLALGFLAPAAKAPTLRSSAAFLLILALASLGGVMFSSFFLAYPLVFLPLLTLLLFHTYYTTSLQSMKLWLIISMLAIPMMSLQGSRLGGIIATNLFVNALLAMMMVWVVFLVFPKHDSIAPTHQTQALPQQDNRQRFLSALHKTLVVIPVLFLFFVFNLSDALLVLIFIAVLSMNPATSNKKAGIGIILANLGGGIAAILVYNVLTIAPSYFYSGLLTLLVGMFFANGLFSTKPVAPLYGMAFSTFLLILGNVINLAGEAGEMVWIRIFQIGLAVVYVVMAFGLLNRFTAAHSR
jgi:hypothetical protein